MKHQNGMVDCPAMKYHYEGKDIHKKVISKAMGIIDNMYYSCANPPYVVVLF